MGWKNRIVETGTVDPWSVEEHPLQWRTHSDKQASALAGALEEVGWVQDVIVNRTTNRLLDGHLRVWLARKEGEKEVPCKFVELSEEEENLILATLDPIGAMAGTNATKQQGLLTMVSAEDERMREFLESLRKEEDTGGLDEGGPKEMELQPYEHYDYVMLTFTDRRDFMQAIQRLGLKKVAHKPKAKQTKEVGLCRVLDGRKVLEMLSESSSRPEEEPEE